MTDVIYSDLDNRLRLTKEGDLRVVINEEAIATAVENILLTRQGERVMRPEFGSRLERYLFEPISEQVGQLIGLEVYRALKENDNRYEVNNVEVLVDYERSAYILRISLRLRGFEEGFEIVRVLVKR